MGFVKDCNSGSVFIPNQRIVEMEGLVLLLQWFSYLGSIRKNLSRKVTPLEPDSIGTGVTQEIYFKMLHS